MNGGIDFTIYGDFIKSSYAQELFNEWLSKQQVVYGFEYDLGKFNGEWSVIKTYDDNSKARLICIEPILRCQHPKDKIKCTHLIIGNDPGFMCECGVKVEPISFGEVK